MGERGEALSVGERQLVALARAYVADPDLLVLDEATSAVDPATEVRLQRTLDAVTRGRTTVAIAHRLSTAQAADEVIVVDRGRIVQRGPHDELVARPGVGLRPALRLLAGADPLSGSGSPEPGPPLSTRRWAARADPLRRLGPTPSRFRRARPRPVQGGERGRSDRRGRCHRDRGRCSVGRGGEVAGEVALHGRADRGDQRLRRRRRPAAPA